MAKDLNYVKQKLNNLLRLSPHWQIDELANPPRDALYKDFRLI